MSRPDALSEGRLPWGGWVLMKPEDVPPSWRARAVSFALVPLLPNEMRGVLREGSTEPEIEGRDLHLVRLLADGTPVSRAARELRLPLRTVQRKVERLRERFGAETTAELVAFLASRGLSRGDSAPGHDAGRRARSREHLPMRSRGEDR